jgi:tripartite-type tricarboxylate transporter receptor subunit TctC
MRRNMRSVLYKMGIAAAAIATIGPTVAQDSYPNQPIKIIVPFSAGGGTDITARLLGDQLRTILRQSVVVDNRPGNAGMIGTRAVAKSAAPDGYTLLVASGEMAVNPHLYKVMPYDWTCRLKACRS